MRFTYQGQQLTVNWQYFSDGSTEARVKDEFGKIISRGVTNCSPRDEFNKKTGRKLAFGRAIRNFIPREHRKMVWTQFAQELNHPELVGLLLDEIENLTGDEDLV